MADLKPSSNQKKMIKMIEQHLDIKFKGKTMKEAGEFLDEHMKSMEGVDLRKYKKPSKKQIDAIGKIEDLLNVPFDGETMQDACEFLDKYMDEYMRYWSDRREKSGYDPKKSKKGKR